MRSPDSLAAAEVDRRLRRALRELRQAERNAVLWFAEVQKRKLYRDLGYSSIYHYAGEALGFSRPRIAQFIRLCDCLDDLPALKGSLATGEVSWTKAREIAKVATPETDEAWVEFARWESRRKLERRVRMTQTKSRARRRSRDRQLILGDAKPSPPDVGGAGSPSAVSGDECASPPDVGGAGAPSGPARASASQVAPHSAPQTEALDGPVNLSLRFSPDQYARYEALLEKLRKTGVRGSREDTLLAGMVALLINENQDSLQTAAASSGDRRRSASDSAISRRVSPGNSRPHYQIVVQQCEDCGRTSIPTSRGPKRVSAVEAEAMRCDALVHRSGKPNRATIPPAVRRAVLARDGYHCKTPGCGAAHFLEVHHVVPREMGGTNTSKNLVTLCSVCHRLMHEDGGRLLRHFQGGYGSERCDGAGHNGAASSRRAKNKTSAPP